MRGPNVFLFVLTVISFGFLVAGERLTEEERIAEWHKKHTWPPVRIYQMQSST
jgi:hypothetical protein